MATQTNCPRCQAPLVIPDQAPDEVTCPRCLGRVQHIRPAGGARAPLRVIPIEEETRHDASVARAVIIVLALLALGGTVYIANETGGNLPGKIIGVGAVIAVIAVIIVIGLYGGVERESDAPSAHPPPLPDRVTGIQPLEYSTYRRDASREPVSPGAFAGGFFAALGTCGATFLLLLSTINFRPISAHGLFLLLAIVMVIAMGIGAASVARRPGWRGFGRGTVTGLCLGMLALGPCAFCYMFTLQ
jgi:hypothetical protein